MEKKGEHAKTKAIYEAVLKQSPNTAMAANNLAFYYAEHEPTPENLSKAEKLLEPIVKTKAAVAHFVDTRAWIHYRRGEYEAAKNLLTGIGDTAKDNPVFSYHLGMTCLRLGEKAEARENLKLALESNAPFPGRKEAEAALKSASL